MLVFLSLMSFTYKVFVLHLPLVKSRILREGLLPYPASNIFNLINENLLSVKTYNLLVLCSEDYIVEPASLQFLVKHGFDFSAQYSLGIGYNRGNDPQDEKDLAKQHLRYLFSEVVKCQKPLVLHNGLVDLIFIYHNLWTALPPKLDTFISDVCEMFPNGVYDTKYLADYVARTQASYLEFVFRKQWRINADKNCHNRPHVKISFAEYSDNDCDVDVRYIGGDNNDGIDDTTEVCTSYANHGHCEEEQCNLSHDIDLIVTKKTQEQDKKWRKRKFDNSTSEVSEEPTKKTKTDNCDTKESKVKADCDTDGVTKVKTGGHRAGYDAFMTGFSFVSFLVHHTQLPAHPESWAAHHLKTEKIVNKIYLVSKDFPLLLQKSAFAKCSGQHDAKMKRLGLYQDIQP